MSRSSPVVDGDALVQADAGTAGVHAPVPGAHLADLERGYAEDVPALVVAQDPVPVADPRLVVRNDDLARDLGMDLDEVGDEALAAIIGGSALPAGARPVAQAYAGHQFGGYSPRLGDGRQVVLGEVVAPDGRRVDLALKGSGRTPFSRAGDGRAGLGPALREHLLGEAMHALGVPTTRSLGVVTTGEQIRREHLEPGAVLARVAASHLRIGTVQFAAATGDRDVLAALVDHALDRHGPAPTSTSTHGTDLPAAATDRGARALALLDAVVARQAELVAQWMHLGFIHGVMNTDNMALSGETIDYGPCAFMEAHDQRAVFSSIDHQGRYAFGNQPGIAHWNLARLAEALLPLVDDRPGTATFDPATVDQAAVDAVSTVLDTFPGRFRAAWHARALAKLALPGDRGAADGSGSGTGSGSDGGSGSEGGSASDVDEALAMDFHQLLADGRPDHTLAWRRLADAAEGDPAPLRDLFDPATHDRLDAWLRRWTDRRLPDAPALLRTRNPLYVPRNHLVEEALAAALDGDLAPFERLLGVVTSPFEERMADVRYAHTAPAGFTDSYVTFCGT